MENKSNSFQILIVDDHQANIKVLGSTLSKEGYKIIVATDGLQALRAVERILPDLILLDINMPNMDGFETCLALKTNERTKSIPIIFLTARIESEDIVKGFELGASDYITKPFKQAELLARVKTQLDLKWKTEKLVDANEKVYELIRVLLHDISNPLTGIKGILELGDEEPEMLIKLRSTLVNATNNCFAIINGVRKMQALEDGKLSLELFPMKIYPNLKDSLYSFEKKLLEKNLAIEWNIPEGITVMVDHTSFTHSVFNNIISNAIKFSNIGGKIVVTAKQEDNWVILSIEDNGLGIPESILNEIFNITKPTTRKGTAGEYGTGYGMPIVKKFVEAFGGKIQVVSKGENQGTTVILKLRSATNP